MKACRVCGKPFEPRTSMQFACSAPCAFTAIRAPKKATRAERARIKSRQDWIREAQQAFNAWIRYRDRWLSCVSCGTCDPGQWHAGHYRTTKAQPSLRFNELNCHKQCAQCNNFDSGNIVEYRINLLHKIGADAMEWLEGPHDPKRWTTDELKGIRDEYRAKLRAAKRSSECPGSLPAGGG